MVAESDIAVRTVGLTKVFRDFWLREKVVAVRGLDLAVRQGEVYGLLGPNGSGKTTIIKMALGLMFPTRGTIRVLGKGPGDVAAKNRIGFLPEESYLYPFLDAHETLDFYGRLFHLPRTERRRRTQMLLDMVGLTGQAYRRVGEYSKGMQRRIGMAQALINDPDLLILDEPTSGMDPLAARQFKDLILELSRRGKTIILSSHLLADMEDVCHRVGILFAGQLRTEGSLETLLARQNLTQLTTQHLEGAELDRLREYLSGRNLQLLAVEAPKDRLEALFLRIIRDAQAQRARTGVPVETGQVAAFLRAPEGRELIERLTAPEARAAGAAESSPAPAAAPAPIDPAALRELVADPGVLRELLDQPATPPPPGEGGPQGRERDASTSPHPPLRGDLSQRERSQATQSAGETPAPPAKADRSVIDSLVPKPPPAKGEREKGDA